MIEPHNKYTWPHNSVTTSRHDKSTKKNVTTSMHHGKTTPHNEVITQRHDKNTSRQDSITRHNGEPHNVMKKPHKIMIKNHIRQLWLSIIYRSSQMVYSGK